MSRQIHNGITVVTEINIPIDLTEEDRVYYDKYTDFINNVVAMYDVGDDFLTSLDGNIKNTFQLIQACNSGCNIDKGGVHEHIDKEYYLYSLAEHLGWNKDNDTTIEYYKDIESNYHPSKIAESAYNFYDIVGLRRKFLANYPPKFKEMLKFVEFFKDRKTVIFNRGTDVCDKVVRILEANNITAYPFYSNLATVPFLDHKGNIVLYKTGAKAGMPKVAGTTRRQNYAIDEFKTDRCNVISFSANLYKKVDLDNISLIIFTSGDIPKVRDMIKKSRPTKFKITSNDVYVINLYVRATIDEERFMYRQINNSNRIIYADNFDHFKQLLSFKPKPN